MSKKETLLAALFLFIILQSPCNKKGIVKLIHLTDTLGKHLATVELELEGEIGNLNLKGEICGIGRRLAIPIPGTARLLLDWFGFLNCFAIKLLYAC